MRLIVSTIIVAALVCLADGQAAATEPKRPANPAQGEGPITQSTAKPAAAKPPEAKLEEPDKWPLARIRAAQKACKAILRKTGAIATPVKPMKRGPCGDPAPVKLIQVGKVPVTFNPAPTVNCQMVAALAKWIDKGLQPLARKHIGARLTEISVMSSYSCRNAYGRKNTRLSEHALGNALDIGGFVFADGLKARLLAHWGETQRDIAARDDRNEGAVPKPVAEAATRGRTRTYAATPREAGASPARRPMPRPPVWRRPRIEQVAATGSVPAPSETPGRTSSLAGSSPPGLSGADPASTTPLVPPLPARRPSLKERMQWVQIERLEARRKAEAEEQRLRAYRAELMRFLYARGNLGGPKAKGAGARKLATGKPDPNREAFLRGAWTHACKIFGTVLGPEANEAHRNHFHVDLAERRYNNYCR